MQDTAEINTAFERLRRSIGKRQSPRRVMRHGQALIEALGGRPTSPSDIFAKYNPDPLGRSVKRSFEEALIAYAPAYRRSHSDLLAEKLRAEVVATARWMIADALVDRMVRTADISFVSPVSFEWAKNDLWFIETISPDKDLRPRQFVEQFEILQDFRDKIHLKDPGYLNVYTERIQRIAFAVREHFACDISSSTALLLNGSDRNRIQAANGWEPKAPRDHEFVRRATAVVTGVILGLGGGAVVVAKLYDALTSSTSTSSTEPETSSANETTRPFASDFVTSEGGPDRVAQQIQRENPELSLEGANEAVATLLAGDVQRSMRNVLRLDPGARPSTERFVRTVYLLIALDAMAGNDSQRFMTALQNLEGMSENSSPAFQVVARSFVDRTKFGPVEVSASEIRQQLAKVRAEALESRGADEVDFDRRSPIEGGETYRSDDGTRVDLSVGQSGHPSDGGVLSARVSPLDGAGVLRLQLFVDGVLVGEGSRDGTALTASVDCGTLSEGRHHALARVDGAESETRGATGLPFTVNDGNCQTL